MCVLPFWLHKIDKNRNISLWGSKMPFSHSYFVLRMPDARLHFLMLLYA